LKFRNDDNGIIICGHLPLGFIKLKVIQVETGWKWSNR